MTALAGRIAAVITALIVAVGPIPGPGPGPTRPPTPTPSHPAVVLASLGDSLTYQPDGSATASYRGELSRVLTLAGQPHTWALGGIPGVKCSYWAANVEAFIVANQPDVILLDCGTNDTPTDDTQADYDTILDVAAAHGVTVVAALIGIPDMRTPTNSVRPEIDDWMHLTNDRIEASLASHPGVRFIDTQRIPANLEWLQSDGVHWTARTMAAVGQLFYEPLAQILGLPTLDGLNVTLMCGLSGSWYTDPEPVPYVDYIPCTR